jgi:flagellar hook-associated protein 3 FlgL
MRVSTTEIYRQGVNSILDGQSKVGETQLQISSGKRILSPSDDPSGAVQTLELSTALAVNSQFQRNNDIVIQKLGAEENTLNSVVNNLQRVRELVVQGNNDSQTGETRGYIASEIRQLFDEMFGLANSRDANGEYIFAGFRSETQPYSLDASGNVSYQGDDAQRFVQISPVRQVAIGDPGSEVFNNILSGNGTFTTAATDTNTGNGIMSSGVVVDLPTWQANTDTYTLTFTEPTPGNLEYEVTDSGGGSVLGPVPYQSGADISFQGVQVNIEGTPAAGDTFTVAPSTNQSIFETYQDLIGALELGGANNPAQNAQVHTRLNQALENLDQDLENISRIRSGIGARMNALDNQSEINSGLQLQLQTVKSSIEDLDYAEAIGRFQLQMTGLQAAQQTYVQIQGLSLFNFLR